MLATELTVPGQLKYFLPVKADASAGQLRRFRPTTLAATAAGLRDYVRKYRALDLLRRFFPDSFQEFYPGEVDLSGLAWYSLMADLATSLKNSQLFPLNEEALEDAWRYWMETVENEALDELAVFLDKIPVRFFGFTSEGNVYRYPWVGLLHTLLANRRVCESKECALTSGTFEDLATYDEFELAEDVAYRMARWRQYDREVAWLRMSQIERAPDTWPEPVQWLPGLAKWAVHSTGNPLLDIEFSWYGRECWFDWDTDFERVKALWQQARPLVDVLERVRSWYELDKSTNLNRLARFIMNGQGDWELDW